MLLGLGPVLVTSDLRNKSVLSGDTLRRLGGGLLGPSVLVSAHTAWTGSENAASMNCPAQFQLDKKRAIPRTYRNRTVDAE